MGKIITIDKNNPALRRPFRLSDMQDMWDALAANIALGTNGKPKICSGFNTASDGSTLTAGVIAFNEQLWMYDGSAPITVDSTIYGATIDSGDERVFDDGSTSLFSHLNIVTTNPSETTSEGFPVPVLIGILTAENIAAWKQGEVVTDLVANDQAQDTDIDNLQTGLANEITGRQNADSTEATARQNADATLQANINTVNGKIDPTVTSTDKVMPKSYIDNKANEQTAHFLTYDAAGNPFPTKAALLAATTFYYGGVAFTPTPNDYLTVKADEGYDGNQVRYVYIAGNWQFSYVIERDDIVTGATIGGVNVPKSGEILQLPAYPTSLPASGGNAGTLIVESLPMGTDILAYANTLPLLTKKVVYIYNPVNSPISGGVIFEVTRSDSNQFASVVASSIAIGNSLNKVFHCQENQNKWSAWREDNEGGDAATLGGSTKEDLMLKSSSGFWIPSLGNGSATNITYDSNGCNYTRVGNLVHINAILTLTGAGTGSALQLIKGLPFKTNNNFLQNLNVYTESGVNIRADITPYTSGDQTLLISGAFNGVILYINGSYLTND